MKLSKTFILYSLSSGKRHEGWDAALVVGCWGLGGYGMVLQDHLVVSSMI